MPGFNRTGPQGMGPGTGHGRGQCTPGARRFSGYGPGPVIGAGRGGTPRGGAAGRVYGGGRGRGRGRTEYFKSYDAFSEGKEDLIDKSGMK